MSLARRLVVLAVAFTMALQCYLAQTHIHSLPQGFAGAVKTATEQSPAKTPIDHSPLECPLCQAIVHAGAAVISATPTLNLPLAWIETVRLVSTLRPSADVTAHEWQSRAPPRF
jgi:hypothetical protein